MAPQMPGWVGLIISIAGAAASLWAKLRRPTIEDKALTQAKAAGAALQQVTELKAHDEEVQKAADAGGAVAGAVASDDGLRAYEAADPNNRARGGQA